MDIINLFPNPLCFSHKTRFANQVLIPLQTTNNKNPFPSLTSILNFRSAMQTIDIELEPQSLSHGSIGNRANEKRKSWKQTGSFTTIREIRNSRDRIHKSRVALSQCTVYISEDSRHHDIAHCKGIANVRSGESKNIIKFVCCMRLLLHTISHTHH